MSWPDSISAWRMAWRSASSERSPSPISSCQNDCPWPGKSRLEQEIGQLVQEALEVDRIGQLGDVLAVGGEAHAYCAVSSEQVSSEQWLRFRSTARFLIVPRPARRGSTRGPGSRSLLTAHCSPLTVIFRRARPGSRHLLGPPAPQLPPLPCAGSSCPSAAPGSSTSPMGGWCSSSPIPPLRSDS